MKLHVWLAAVTAAILATIACERDEKPAPNPESLPDDLVAKRALYVERTPEVADADGAVEVEQCDSGHFSFLRAVGAGIPINARAFMDAERKVHRRTLSYKECYPDESGSSVSADELLYLLAYGVKFKDRQLLQDVFSYGKEHAWVMGEGDIFRTIMRPSLQSLYARALRALGGPDFAERIIPPFEPGARKGFEAQLQVVSILVDLNVTGALTSPQLEALRDQAARQPGNALFMCAASRFDPSLKQAAWDLLREEKIWPRDRLPTTDDYCDSWVTQRDRITPEGENDDWQPCPERPRKHSGGDFLFAVAVCAGEF
jgi:hypothetical protein